MCAKLVGDPQMTRLSIRLPKKTLDELNEMALDSGMYQTFFYQASIIVGARRLWQLFNGEVLLQPMPDDDTTKDGVTKEMTMREKAERLNSTRLGRSRRRGRAQDYMDGLLDVSGNEEEE